MIYFYHFLLNYPATHNAILIAVLISSRQEIAYWMNFEKSILKRSTIAFPSTHSHFSKSHSQTKKENEFFQYHDYLFSVTSKDNNYFVALRYQKTTVNAP
jgi:hypothetical protein